MLNWPAARYERGADSWTDVALLNGLDVATDPISDFREETYAFFHSTNGWESSDDRVRAASDSVAQVFATFFLFSEQHVASDLTRRPACVCVCVCGASRWCFQKVRGLAKYWLVLDAKRSAHIKAASIVQKSAAFHASRQHLQDRAAELSDIMATVLAKYDEAVAHQQLLTEDDNNAEGEMEEDKPLPEFSTERFNPDEERFDPSIDLTSLFRVRHSEHTQRKGAHKKVRSVAAGDMGSAGRERL